MTISKIRRIMAEEGVFFSFYGALSQPFIDFFLDTITKQFNHSTADKKIAKALIVIAIEQVQNIMNYSQELSHLRTTQLRLILLIENASKPR